MDTIKKNARTIFFFLLFLFASTQPLEPINIFLSSLFFPHWCEEKKKKKKRGEPWYVWKGKEPIIYNTTNNNKRNKQRCKENAIDTRQNSSCWCFDFSISQTANFMNSLYCNVLHNRQFFFINDISFNISN